MRPFALLESRSGRPFSSAAALRGRVWVATFLPASTPLGVDEPRKGLARMVTRLAAELPRSVGLVGFAARPAAAPGWSDHRDAMTTPGELADAPGTSGNGRWLLLTGSPQALRRLGREDFQLPEPEPVPAPLLPAATTASAETGADAGLTTGEAWPGGDQDSLFFTLVDRHGRRRGTYPGEAAGTGIDTVGRLVADARRLLGSRE